LARLGFLAAVTAVCASVAALPAAAASAQRIDVRGQLDAALRSEIQQAVAPLAAAPGDRLDARRRAREAGEAAVAVLRSQGYYDYTVEPDIGEGDQPQPFITITLGPRSTIAAPTIAWDGAPPDAQVAKAADGAMALKVGQPGRAADVIAAEGRVIAVLRERGYADAAAEPRVVTVDHADHSLQPTFKVAAGPLVRLGDIRVTTKGRTNPAWVARLAAWKKGSVYRPEAVAQLERRLLDTGVYQEVTVAVAPASETGPDGLRPVIVSLADQPRGSLQLDASYATSEGVGVDGRWILYNRLGRADTITNTLRVAQIDSRLQSALKLPDWRRLDQTLTLTSALYRDDTPAYLDWGLGVSADVTRRYTKTSFVTYGLSFDATDTDEKETANFIGLSARRKLATFGALAAYAIDRSNDPLDPTSGWRLEARIEPRLALGDGSIAYLAAQAQVTGYLPFGATSGTVLAGRLKLGEIVGGSIPLVPPQDRFYAGGGGSVRGYAYQAVGPRYPDNTPEGGLSLLEASVELRQRITQQWGVVLFVDAGAVGRSVTPNFNEPSVGVGAGVRYNAGFGPIRLDVATPLNPRTGDASIQVYLSIGQSF
jgi:translocation and assembly module TamA